LCLFFIEGKPNAVVTNRKTTTTLKRISTLGSTTKIPKTTNQLKVINSTISKPSTTALKPCISRCYYDAIFAGNL
jgi:carbohydrate-binding DOMON domain-containing protein